MSAARAGHCGVDTRADDECERSERNRIEDGDDEVGKSIPEGRGGRRADGRELERDTSMTEKGGRVRAGATGGRGGRAGGGK